MVNAISLNDALDSIAAAFDFDADQLIEYAALDPHGGYHDQYDDGFPTGSIWRVEGQVLYALVRALAEQFPNQDFLELGTHKGCSATHIAQALHDANTHANLFCVDLNGGAGNMIPAYLKGFIQFIPGDMFDYLKHVSSDMTAKFMFILEDGSHHMEDVEQVWRSAYHLLKPGGVIISHDAEHLHVPSNTGVGAAVREGIARAGYYALQPPVRTYKIAPSDCGFALWRRLPEDVSVLNRETSSVIDNAVLSVAPESKRKNDTIPSIAELMANHDLSAMTIAELKDFAAQRNIPLDSSTRTKGAIIAAIEAVTG